MVDAMGEWCKTLFFLSDICNSSTCAYRLLLSYSSFLIFLCKILFFKQNTGNHCGIGISKQNFLYIHIYLL